jgi:hypothetical protein
MSQEQAAPITRVLGWKLTDDKTHAIIGFSQGPEGSEFAIAIRHEMLIATILSMVDALAAFPDRRMESGEKLSIETDWYEVGGIDGSDDVSVSLRVPSGGFLRFHMKRPMAERLADTLGAVVDVAPSQIPPGTRRN